MQKTKLKKRLKTGTHYYRDAKGTMQTVKPGETWLTNKKPSDMTTWEDLGKVAVDDKGNEIKVKSSKVIPHPSVKDEERTEEANVSFSIDDLNKTEDTVEDEESLAIPGDDKSSKEEFVEDVSAQEHENALIAEQEEADKAAAEKEVDEKNDDIPPVRRKKKTAVRKKGGLKKKRIGTSGKYNVINTATNSVINDIPLTEAAANKLIRESKGSSK